MLFVGPSSLRAHQPPDQLSKTQEGLTRISHKFCNAKAIFGKKVICRKGLACARRVHQFRQSVFRP